MHERKAAREDILSMVFLHYEIMNHDLFTTLYLSQQKGFFLVFQNGSFMNNQSIDWFVFLFPMCAVLNFTKTGGEKYLIIVGIPTY